MNPHLKSLLTWSLISLFCALVLGIAHRYLYAIILGLTSAVLGLFFYNSIQEEKKNEVPIEATKTIKRVSTHKYK